MEKEGKIIHAEDRFREQSKKEIKRKACPYPECGPLADVTREEIEVFKEDPDKFDLLRQRVLAEFIRKYNL